MFSEEEKKFMIYWEQNRDTEKKTVKQWLVGLPLGMLFGIPILVNFLSGWFKRAKMVLNGQMNNHNFNPLVLIIALFLIISFIAIFSKRHKWDMYEQKYLELKAREQTDKF
ncbi:MAG: hypothetical protein WKF89_14680 [Chitinophagaceae bacterium]